MFDVSVTTQVPGGGDINKLISDVERASIPTVGDLLYAGQRQRTRILQRTARGVDVDEAAFKPYSTNGPYYYYPGKDAKNRRASVLRTARKIGVASKGGPNRQGEKVTGVGIKFPSYAAFKRALGRLSVDLRGPKAPHMLQAMIVKVGGVVLPGSDVNQGNLFDSESVDYDQTSPATELYIGIYGAEAERANNHNTGANGVPKRRFLGASQSDRAAVVSDLTRRVKARIKLMIGGGAA